ncbi:sigma-70 family RNA polymerase sigma factor [Sphingomonas sp. 37zxx]|uniref:sigma-70 family RNA polymerase sigma factor n=1 Tax=Sphingomonas sp. 37zxx TaxID=1550073 RepID=UPI000ACC3039|nr:sigma-70 family RNA polymerase sigma factor [Sphingomonas sp. 37zxx]
MSKITIALEAAVATVIAETPATDGKPSARRRANVDRAFATILKLIAPRIRHFIRQYGLVSHWEDAEQCCAIAVHRAIMGYDPTKAQFTTFVNWQIRGELQSLRFRVMTDQRPSAKKVDAVTVSLHAMTSNSDGDEASLESILEDESALARTEAGASDYLAQSATNSLIEEYIAYQRTVGVEQLRKRPRPKRAIRVEPTEPGTATLRRSRGQDLCPIELAKLEEKLARDKEIVERRVFDVVAAGEADIDRGVTKERVRQITKRAAQTIADLTQQNPRFAMMAEYRKPKATGTRTRSRAVNLAETAPILPAIGQPHNTLSRLVAVDPGSEPQVAARSGQEIADCSGADEAQIMVQPVATNAPGSSARH